MTATTKEKIDKETKNKKEMKKTTITIMKKGIRIMKINKTIKDRTMKMDKRESRWESKETTREVDRNNKHKHPKELNWKLNRNLITKEKQ